MTNRKKIDCTKLKPVDRVACEVLIDARRPLTTNEVAEYGNMSWLTAKKHLEKLSQMDIGINRDRKRRADFWFIEDSDE